MRDGGRHPGRGSRARLHVLMTADAVGGVWTYALDLARGLAGLGARTTLAVLGPLPDPAQAADACRVEGLDLVALGGVLDWMAEEPQALAETGAALADLARRSGADLVHLNSPALAAAAAFPVPVVGVCHSCVATWWDGVRSGPLPDDFAWRTRLLGQGYRAADALLAPTEAFAAATAALYGLADAPKVVRNGRGVAAARPAAPAVEQPFAFTAGRLWDEGKNLAALDRAAADLPFPVLAAGATEGPNGARIVLSHVRLLGRLREAEIAGWLAARPIFVSTARYEPFGLGVLEAAQAGCPLVLSDIPTFRELWDGAALFVPPCEDAAIAAAISALAADPAEGDRLGATARERSARYTVEAMADEVMTVYRTLLDRQQAPALRSALA